jgi:hypothetical protein
MSKIREGSVNLGSIRGVRLRNEQEKRLDFLKDLISDEIYDRLVKEDLTKFKNSKIVGRRGSTGRISVSVLIRLGIDLMIERIESELRDERAKMREVKMDGKV